MSGGKPCTTCFFGTLNPSGKPCPDCGGTGYRPVDPPAPFDRAVRGLLILVAAMMAGLVVTRSLGLHP
jgi:hypothetical protein